MLKEIDILIYIHICIWEIETQQTSISDEFSGKSWCDAS